MEVIDADGHIVEKESDIRAYLPEPHSKRSGSLLPSDGQDSLMGGRLGGLEDNDLPTRLKDMDIEGIATSVLFPTTSFRVSQTTERDYALAYCRAYNDFIANVCKTNPRLKAIGLVPFQNVIYGPSAVVGELNRAITELGLAGIAVSCQGLKEHLGSEIYWPIYEELQRLGVPLCVHNRHAPPGENIFDSLLFKHAVGRPIMTAIQFAGLMYGGVPEKFPKLNIAFLECGIGWLPYWVERLDEEYEKRAPEAPLLKAKPSEYLKTGNWYCSTEPDERALPYVIENFGADIVLFASDYPHWDGLYPNAVSTLAKRQDISETAKQKILGANAKRFYGWG
jgi:predicted TIM-barrel fold metal-dependent hydrolase